MEAWKFDAIFVWRREVVVDDDDVSLLWNDLRGDLVIWFVGVEVLMFGDGMCDVIGVGSDIFRSLSRRVFTSFCNVVLTVCAFMVTKQSSRQLDNWS